jgi:hypothetical protein
MDVTNAQANYFLDPINASKGVPPMPYFQGAQPGWDAIVKAFGPIITP